MSFDLNYAAYIFLYAAVAVLLVGKVRGRKLAWIFVGLALFTALFVGQLDSYVFLPIVLLAYALNGIGRKQPASFGVRLFGGIIAMVLLTVLAVHGIKGFHNLLVLDGVNVSKDGLPFTMYLNMDKALAGIFVLAFMPISRERPADWHKLLLKTSLFAVLFGFFLLGLAVLCGKIHWDPKIPSFSWIWAINNLLFVSMAEEALFRGFIQKNLVSVFSRWEKGPYLALLITSLLFAFAHYAGGIAYSIWGLLAGLGYGWLYLVTGRIEASIVAHFILNAMHFFLFTYPVLG